MLANPRIRVTASAFCHCVKSEGYQRLPVWLDHAQVLAQEMNVLPIHFELNRALLQLLLPWVSDFQTKHTRKVIDLLKLLRELPCVFLVRQLKARADAHCLSDRRRKHHFFGIVAMAVYWPRILDLERVPFERSYAGEDISELDCDDFV